MNPCSPPNAGPRNPRIDTAIDLLVTLDPLKVGRVSDADQMYQVTDRGRHICYVSADAVNTCIERGWVVDVSVDLMDEAIYRLSGAGLVHLELTFKKRTPTRRAS